jgi:head-tail adaptor
MTAGRMREKLNFQKRSSSDDGYGNDQAGDFETAFTAAAELVPLKGTEAVMASRLSGVQPFVVRIYSNSQSRSVGASWRAVDTRDPNRIFNITAVANMDQKNRMLDIMVTQGVAT